MVTSLPRIGLVLCAILSGSCSSPEPFQLRKTAANAPAPPHEVGTITLVNSTLGFVLIDTDMKFAPQPGIALKTFSPGAKPATDPHSAILTVGAERRPPFVVADIVQGAPQKGDGVYQ